MTEHEAETDQPLLGAGALDPGLDRQLRQNLRTLRDQHAGTEVGRLLDEVLAGRRSLRDVARTPQFDAVVAAPAEAMAQQWSRLSPAEREALVEEGRAELERHRAAAAAERPRRPEDG